jgi:CubicO group peptidase (beta-lactamase class C family)
LKSVERTIQSQLDQFVAEDSERGIQVAVYHHGNLVVNAFAGTTGAPGEGRVDAGTLFPVFSTTKGMAATLIHLLVERGSIDYETPIAEVWPEFAAHGKDGITLRHALNHTSGIPNLPAGLGHAELCDWDTVCAAIAGLTPISPPGRENAYHAITYGWILGEVARRVDGRSFGNLLRDEISTPLALNDELFIGIPDEVENRVAVLESKAEVGPHPLAPDDVAEPIPSLVRPLHLWMNRADARRACIPASNGIMTAHAVARHYAALLPGGVDGVELLPAKRVALATAPQWPGNAKQGDPPMAQRLGYTTGLNFALTAFGHAGFGGSVGFADPASGLAFGLARNRLDSERTVASILETMAKELAR